MVLPPPPPPLSLLCLISIVTLYLMICYAIIGFIAKSEVLRVDSHEVHHPGLSMEELQKLQSFKHRINEGGEESLSCAICLDDYKDFEVCKRFPSCEHVFHSHCIDVWLVHRRTCPICRTSFEHIIHVV